MLNDMIGSLRGKIISKTDKFVILETAGVGYKVSVSPDVVSKASATGTELFLFIHTHVREDSLDLYGFLGEEDLSFFEMLLGVSGIGPRSALAILGIASIPTLRQAIGTGDTSYLTKISGIGKKTAERIVIELRDKLADKNMSEKNGTSLRDELDALEALKSLGYSQNEAREALKKVAPEVNTNAKIREALKILGGK
jgi:Holliday junction DNA helicase RuvA